LATSNQSTGLDRDLAPFAAPNETLPALRGQVGEKTASTFPAARSGRALAVQRLRRGILYVRQPRRDPVAQAWPTSLRGCADRHRGGSTAAGKYLEMSTPPNLIEPANAGEAAMMCILPSSTSPDWGDHRAD